MWTERWPLFQPKEVLSPDGLKLFSKGHMVMWPWFLDILQDFRRYIGKPFLINHGELKLRGWRSLEENAGISGKLYHPIGCACDVTVEGKSSAEIGKAAELYGFHGIGLYDTFTHVDMRPRLGTKTIIWDYRTIKKD